jgi:hypothetical protein
MGQNVISGRFTAVPETETVTVFLIGMRANRWWKFGKLLPMTTAMARMLNHLVATPEAGLLGFHSWFGRTTIMLSYWESPEHIQRFATDRTAPHLEPWRKFMRESAGSGDIGVWHETYQVAVRDQESVYSDMPPFGLGAATKSAPIGRRSNTARQRMGRQKPAKV